MRSAFLVAAYAAYTYAQNLDSDAIAQADPIPTADIPVVYSTSFDYALPSATVIASTIAYDAAAAAAAVLGASLLSWSAYCCFKSCMPANRCCTHLIWLLRS